jgi:succinoglycan biosynthesis protein ExoM
MSDTAVQATPGSGAGDGRRAGAVKPSIAVCTCTYKRPELLARLLPRLQDQDTEESLDISLIVVDNDIEESARAVVEQFAAAARVRCHYSVQPEQNIALARNCAIRNARADFVALIDDDELPGAGWLITLYNAIQDLGVAGVLGPVLPRFEVEPPKWVLEGKLFERPAPASGAVLTWQSTRTGNALLRRTLFSEGSLWFDPLYGSGGEDRDFFRRMMGAGHSFVWCNEAPVWEHIPAQRWERRVLLKRALLRGKMATNDRGAVGVTSICKSVLAVAMYSTALPFLFLLSYPAFIRYLIKDFDHLGKLLACMGVDLVRERYVRG